MKAPQGHRRYLSNRSGYDVCISNDQRSNAAHCSYSRGLLVDAGEQSVVHAIDESMISIILARRKRVDASVSRRKKTCGDPRASKEACMESSCYTGMRGGGMLKAIVLTLG